MSRLLFFLLLIAAVTLGAHIALTAHVEKSDFSARERNREEVRIAAVTPPTIAARRVEENRKAMQSLAGAACVEISGITAADAARAHDAFVALALGPRLVERRVEEITRHWVFVPAARDRRAAEANMAQLRKQGVSDISIRPDNAISLGVFSTEDAARRFLASIQAKGVTGAEEGPFVKELREIVMLVREPDTELVSRLTLLQRDFQGSELRAVPCPAAS
ncbi:MAG TPA: SPOR domain-containing protein [Usitatibacter sp.]|nr:SPOR domain-containing protein [Usitatibacter sp.]